jgi:hypothetical protein
VIRLLAERNMSGAELVLQAFVWSSLSAAVTALAGVTLLPHDASPAAAVIRVSFHPNDVARRGRFASFFLVATFVGLVGAFFNTQVRGTAST